YIAEGRWHVTGSWVDAVDVNIPSFESLVRQTLYGNGFFKREFGKTSNDVFLPDCFGFGYALPSIAAHCGLKSFSTQKLTWGSAVGVPFDIGLWEGVDGSRLVSAVNPGSYGTQIRHDMSKDTTWLKTATQQGDSSGLYAGYMYFGTGDTGGAPDSLSVDWLTKSEKSDGPLKVENITSDQLYDSVTAQKNIRLPVYNGELLMTHHGVGCYSSEAAMKRWNRKNEQLGDAAERASVIAEAMGGYRYPREFLRDTWIRFIWHQFHDDVTGTSIPEAYEFSWNDEILCLNRFAGVLQNAVEATSPVLDTRAKGTPILIYNPLAVDREDIADVDISFEGKTPASFRVFGPDNTEVPSQVLTVGDGKAHLIFLAHAPSVGYAVYDVRPSDKPCAIQTGLSATASQLDNKQYTVKLNQFGDIISVFDKALNRELLSAPASLQMLHDKPKQWPAWEIQYEDIIDTANTVPVSDKPAEIKVLENGPVRVSIEITRHTPSSDFQQIVSLGAGESGSRVEVNNTVDWYERETLLKAAFPLACANEKVTYDLGLGTIQRGIDQPKLYEVPAHQWADMSSPDGSYGVAVLNDCKYGWDHPDSGTLRLTLIHTPGVYENWSWVGDQRSMDEGHHRFTYAIVGHAGDWRKSNIAWEGARLNQPLYAFQVPEHKGTMGKTFSMLSLVKSDAPNQPAPVMITAVKKAEDTSQIVVRMRELTGSPVDGMKLCFDRPIMSARELNGSEEEVGPVTVDNGSLDLSFKKYQPRTIAVTLSSTKNQPVETPLSAVLEMPFNLDGVSTNENRTDGDFDGHGYTIAGELLPDLLVYKNVAFKFGPRKDGENNVVICEGQDLNIPAGTFNRCYILAAAVDGPAEGKFSVDGKERSVWVQDYHEKLGQWNNRLVGGNFVEEKGQIAPAYINREPVAWLGTHRHTPKGENDAYEYSYLFLVELDLPKGAKHVTLPNDQRIRIMAATAVNTPYDEIVPAHPLYDEIDNAIVNLVASRHDFLEDLDVGLTSPTPGATIRYTLDGSEPTATSAVYKEPIKLTKTTTVKASAFRDNGVSPYSITSKFTKATLIDAVQPPANPVNGLACTYYEGSWDNLPDFDSLAPVKQTVMDSIVIPDFARPEDFGLIFTGYIKVASDGLYDFNLSSDDGSRLWVADSLIVDNDGLHGEGEVPGSIALKAGYHPITIRMFQKKGDEALAVFVSGKNLEKREISPQMLFHLPDAGMKK
ncbi:MAG TPA: glycoside hydrolase family 38 C-terminal domain-containing protein, partial [candidate division Zixibacteria bacterium]|nr:glycoside hydrolase family 38 C-terminal domain-containing protein [candidate division Zixibacteria bacterium]